MSSNSKVLPLALIGIALCFASPAPALEDGQIAAVFAENLNRLRGYTWKAKVDFSMDGEHRSTRVFQVRYLPDGRFERTLISEERKGKATKQERAAEGQLASARTLIDGYTHMKPEAMKEFFGDEYRDVNEDAENGLTRVRSINFFARGDKLSMWVQTRGLQMRRLEIDTVLNGMPAYVVAEFEELKDGPTVAMRSTIRTRHKKKSTQLITENFDFVAPD